MKNFNDFQLSEPLSRAIAELGFEAPSQIQAEAIPLLLAGHTDFLGLAATGTGKTAAFGIPLLERLEDTRGVQALVLCPTRELAIQVAGQLDLLGKYNGVKTVPIYGGTGYAEQLAGLRSGANVVVGTPGRVVDHITKGYLRLDKLKTLVLDEADEMISMGFQEDLETVLKAAPKDQSNIWLFSATMGPEVRHVADAYLKNPQKVQVNKTDMLPATVEQFYFKVHEYDKPDVLCKLIDAADDFYGIIFCQTKALVADVTEGLKGRGYRADALHGDIDQTGRDRVMNAFRERKISILVATDVACRGLDVKDITHVVNYSIPRELDNYVHRIGRTGRNGKPGMAFSLVTFSHRDLIGRIERMTRSRMQEGRVPTAKEIALKRVGKVRAALENRGPQGRVQALLDDSWKPLLESLSKEEISARFLALLCPDLGGNASNASVSANEKEKTEEPRAAAPMPAPVSLPQPSYKERAERPRSGFRKDFKPDFKKGFKQEFKKDFRSDSKPRFERKSFGDQPSFAGKPGSERKFSDKPFAKKRHEPKAFDARFESAPARSDKKPFKKFGAKLPSDSRTPPWERKGARQETRSAGPVRAEEKGPRWKSPGTAKLGGKPRWKINPASQ